MEYASKFTKFIKNLTFYSNKRRDEDTRFLQKCSNSILQNPTMSYPNFSLKYGNLNVKIICSCQILQNLYILVDLQLQHVGVERADFENFVEIVNERWSLFFNVYIFYQEVFVEAKCILRHFMYLRYK